MELRNIYIILRRHWVMIIMITSVSLLVSFIVSWFMLDDLYQSTITVIIVTPVMENQQETPITYDEYYLNTQLVNSYRVLCKTDLVLNAVIDELRLNLTLQELYDVITITSQEGTEFIHITVTTNDAILSMNIANTVATIFQQEVQNLMKRNNVQIVDYATAVHQPVSPDKAMNLILAAVAGITLSIGICFYLEYVDITIKSVRDVYRLLDAPLLGTVQHIPTWK